MKRSNFTSNTSTKFRQKILVKIKVLLLCCCCYSETEVHWCSSEKLSWKFLQNFKKTKITQIAKHSNCSTKENEDWIKEIFYFLSPFWKGGKVESSNVKEGDIIAINVNEGNIIAISVNKSNIIALIILEKSLSRSRVSLYTWSELLYKVIPRSIILKCEGNNMMRWKSGKKKSDDI